MLCTNYLQSNWYIFTFQVLNNQEQAAIVFFTRADLDDAGYIQHMFLEASFSKMFGKNKMYFGIAYANELKDIFKKYGGKGGMLLFSSNKSNYSFE